MFYTVSFLAVAFFPFALAAYGGHLAAKVLDAKDRRKAFVIVWTLALLGVAAAGWQQIMVYRSDRANETKQRKSERDTSELKDEVHDLRTNTSNLISTIAGMFPMIASLNANYSTLARDTAAAKEHHDPRLINNLERKEQAAQQQVNTLSHELLVITMAPQVAEQLRDWYGTNKQKISDMHSQQWEQHIMWPQKHPNDPEGDIKASKDWDAAIKREEQNSSERLSRIIATADFIRKEMLQLIPSQQQSAEDKKQENEFAGTNGDRQSLEKAADYLEDLARRVPPPPK